MKIAARYIPLILALLVVFLFGLGGINMFHGDHDHEHSDHEHTCQICYLIIATVVVLGAASIHLWTTNQSLSRLAPMQAIPVTSRRLVPTSVPRAPPRF